MDYKERCKYLEERIKHLNLIGIALSAEENLNKLFEMIMEEARHITNADGRTLYMKSKDGKKMNFEIVRSDSLKLVMGGTSGNEINWPAMDLFDENGKPNHKSVVAYAANTGKTVNIDDAYEEEGFDFSGTKKADKANG